MNYVNTWFQSSTSDILVELATHAMTKKEFLNKNPDFHIEFEVQFSEKYCTFVPIKKPTILYFSDLHSLELEFVKNVFVSFKDMIGPFELGHVLTVRFKLKSGVLVPRRRYTKYTATQYQQLSYEEAMASSLNYVNNINNPLLPPACKDLFSKRLFEQIDGWKAKCDDLLRFVIASYRYQSKSSAMSPHEYTLLLKIEFGENLGEVKRIVSHKMRKISRMKNPDLVTFMNEERTSDHHVFTVSIMSNNTYTSPIMTFTAVRAPTNYVFHLPQMKEKEIDREITKLWKSLLKVPFPNCPPTPKYP